MRREDRRVVALLGFLHGMVHANILSIPVFLNLAWRSEFNADDLTLGLLAAAGFGGFGLGSVPFGYLADRRPPRTLLLLGTIGIGAAMGCLAASPTIPFLAISLAALGLFSGVYHPTGLAIIARSVEEAGRGMGWHGMGGSLGIASGPAFVGTALALGWPWRSVAALLIVPPLIGFGLVLWQRLPESGRGRDALSPVSPRALLTLPYALILFVYMFAGFAYQGGLTFLPRFIGADFFAVALVLGAIGQVLSGTLADRYRPDRILFALSLGVAAILAVAGILLQAGLGPPSAGFIASGLIFGFLLFSLEPLQNTLVTREVTRPLQGLGFGFTFLSVFGIGSIAPPIAGYLLGQGQATVLFGLLAGSVAISGFLAYVTGWAKRRRPG